MTFTEKIKLSHWEMTNCGEAVFRVLGLPSGIAERATDLLSFAQAIQTEAVEFLMAKKITFESKRITEIRKQQKNFVKIVALNHSLFQVGPLSVDLACGLAAQYGKSEIQISNINSTRFASGLAWQALKRGFNVVVIGPNGSWRGEKEGCLAEISEKSDDLRIVCSLNDFHNCCDIRTIPVQKMLEIAISEGYETESSSAQAFLALSRELWLRSTERSRAQGSEGDKV